MLQKQKTNAVLLRFLLFVVLLCAAAWPVTRSAAQQNNPVWQDVLNRQLQAWESKYPNQALTFIVVRLGIQQTADDALTIAARLSQTWQRPVIVTPTFDPPNTLLHNGWEATQRYFSGQAWDHGTDVLNTIISRPAGHHIEAIHFFSGAVIAFNNEMADYTQFITAHPKMGLREIVAFGAQLQNQYGAALAPTGVAITNIGQDKVNSLTDTRTISSPLVKSAMTLGSAVFGPPHDLLQYELPYGIDHKLTWQGSKAFSPPTLAAGSTSLAPGSAAGGVDFSSLELRYLTEKPAGQTDPFMFGAAMHGVPTAKGRGIDATAATKLAWDSFFVWMAMPEDAFWVNLNPAEPDRIVDSQMGKTDAGRIMLEADFQMKKSVAQLIHPQSATGKAYWDALYNFMDAHKLTSGMCSSFRQWIVPGKITLWQDNQSVYIVDAALDVKLESDKIDLSGYKGGAKNACPDDKSGAQAYAEQVYRQTVLPLLIQQVNTAPEYRDLRTIYYSRILADWYKNTTQTTKTFSDIIGKHDVSAWPNTVVWNPKDLFDAYVKSVLNGEFNITEKVTTTQGDMIITTTRTYVYGGVDFSSLGAVNKLSTAAFNAQKPEAASQVTVAMLSPGGYQTVSDVYWGQSYIGQQPPAASSADSGANITPPILNAGQLKEGLPLDPVGVNNAY